MTSLTRFRITPFSLAVSGIVLSILLPPSIAAVCSEQPDRFIQAENTHANLVAMRNHVQAPHEQLVTAPPINSGDIPRFVDELDVDNKSEAAVPEGLAGSDWNSIRQVYEQNRHAAVAVDGAFRARNPGQQWLTHFDGHGFVVKPNGADWCWGLQLQSYGFPGHQRSINGQASMTADNDRVTYDWHDGVQEWFVNDRSGLEHGFTLSSRPPSAGNSQLGTDDRLELRLAVRGGLRAQGHADGQSVSFVNHQGSAVVNYAGLKVWDADHRVLPARIDVDASGLRLSVDERGARYPLTIDPIARQAYLKASNTDAGDVFGWSVAVSGDTVVVGAHQEGSNATGVDGNQADNSASNSGAVYVFIRDGGGAWSQQAYLKASNTDAGDRFGHSVAVSGDTVVVGAYLEASNATGVDGNQANNSVVQSGAAYVFVRDGSNVWSQQAYLKASNTDASDIFGFSVAVSGDTVVVGAYNEASNATGVNGNQADNSLGSAGAAYVFVRDGGGVWSQQAYLKASNTDAIDQFGESVAVSGDTVVVGAAFEESNATGVNGNETDNSSGDSGAAYVFVRDGGGIWSQQAYLKASNTDAGDQFGHSVAVSGDTVVVGAFNEASNATGVDGNQANNSVVQSGAAYVFVRDGGGVWSQQAYLKASNTETGDIFGTSVAVSGDTVVVGAIWEDSNATGINGNQSDNSADASGAAYVFVRNGSNVWSQQVYLKASNTDASDIFGFSVAVSGGTVVVGALAEDSNATGVNGNQTDNSLSGAGAAYIYVTDSTTINVPADEATIQDCINVAVSGVDECLVADGTYMEAIDFLGKIITVRSENGAGVTEINGTGQSNSVVTFNSFEAADSVLEGFTITGGTGKDVGGIIYGGGVYIKDAGPTINDCDLTSNTAMRGAGMYVQGTGVAFINNCDFSNNNNAVQNGGALHIRNSSPAVDGCTFSSNTGSTQGGAVYTEGSAGSFNDCDFIANSATGAGGAVYNVFSDGLTFTNCDFMNNSAVGGGGMFSLDSDIDIDIATFDSNVATGSSSGGGLHVAQDSIGKISNAVFTNNTANVGSAVHINDNSDQIIVRSTFRDNVSVNRGAINVRDLSGNSSTAGIVNCVFQRNAADRGAAIFVEPVCSVNVVNSIFVGNTANSSVSGQGGGAIQVAGAATVRGCTFTENTSGTTGDAVYMEGSSTFNCANSILWGNGSNEIFVGSATVGIDYSNVSGGFAGAFNIDADPDFLVAPNPGGDGMWDGVNDDFGDLRLLSGSPSIDTGGSGLVHADVGDLDDDGDTAEDTPFDILNQPRVVNIVDMGAYEMPAINAPLGLTGEPNFSKDRYVSFDATSNGTTEIATRVSRVGGQDKYVDCTSLADLGADGWYASLIDGPLPTPGNATYYCDLSGLTTGLHVRGCSIVPGNMYDVAMTTDGFTFSSALSIPTTPPQFGAGRSFGDTVGGLIGGIWTAPDGLVTASDIVAAVQKFSLVAGAAIVARIDTEGAVPNGIVSGGDILRAVSGFAGAPFGSSVTGCLTGTCVPPVGSCE